MLVYTLRNKKDTNEYHLFEGEMNNDKKTCSVPENSICKKMKKSDAAESHKWHFACQDDEYARTICAKIGRPACGTCVSHLYTTYDKANK